MKLFSIALAYLRDKWSNTLLQSLVMALGVAMMTVLILFGAQLKEKLYRDGSGTDVVVGAKGSPLQLVLSSIQHIDIPTGNLKVNDFERLKRHPQVKRIIPISLGDTYKQFRIVGSTHEYLNKFKAKYQKGNIWTNSMEAVIGSRVAKESKLKIGDIFIGAHGLVAGGHEHEDRPYKVTGILEPSGTVLDRLIVTSLESVWSLHEENSHSHNHKKHEHHNDKHKHHNDKHEHHNDKHEHHNGVHVCHYGVHVCHYGVHG
jgi:putative ABC transport system permease protein